MGASGAIPRRSAANAAKGALEETVADMVVTEVRRHGPSSPADLIANVGAPPHAIIHATTRLFVAGVLRLTPDRQRFTLRRRAS